MRLNLREVLAIVVVAVAAGPVELGATRLPEVLRRSGPVRTESIPLARVDSQHQYSLLYSIRSPRLLREESRVSVEVVQDESVLASKVLHAGDADFYTQFRTSGPAGAVTIRIRPTAFSGAATLQVNKWPRTDQVRSGPMRTWQQAMPIVLGKTVFAAGDDAMYIPLDVNARKSNLEHPNNRDWYRFEFDGKAPKLVFFQVELLDRDQIPVSLNIYHAKAGGIEEFFDGEDPVALPHEVQALQGNKFTPRLLKDAGTYYVAIRASHPEYKLRTRVYDPPPYSEPQAAVRTALDYVLAAGDSWHANTPRRGGVFDRVSSAHQETSLCVACHATHFPLRAQLYAARNGYPVVQREQVQFMTERFYNNPRPFYGFEQSATWARVISAPANVLGRMSHLLTLFEEQITGRRREGFHQGVAEYLKLYYAGRDKLPPDETNGNTPLVSAHEVAWYAWSVTKDPKLGELIAAGEVKNTIDLCYQTLALAEIDRAKYAEVLKKNAEKLLGMQREDGQWSARFENSQPAVEFQTGHALWALHAAGVPASEPKVAKAIQLLLKRQQSFGGWMDPLQSFENFRTPFRETQMSVLALSSYYPQSTRQQGWNASTPATLSADPVVLLNQLADVWDVPPAAVVQQIEAAARSNDALIRQAAVEALGRLGRMPEEKLLGDASKLVQRTAAWAVRQAYSRQDDLASAKLASWLNSADDRTRSAATRVFASHFSALAKHAELAQGLSRIAATDPVIANRMSAVTGLWQFWFWSSNADVKGMIEDALLARLGKPEHAWVRQSVSQAIYNVADENIRYLYNNWVPLLARKEDRDQAIRGRLAHESRLANKFASVLASGSVRAQKQLLLALTELPLRRSDVYNLDADLSKLSAPTYNRIGNDIEQIAFFGEAAERFAAALQPLLDSKDMEMRTLASRAVLLVRESRFGDVNRLAGNAGGRTKGVLTKVATMSEAEEVAKQLRPPAAVAAVKTARTAARPAAVKLDEAFFRGYVQPILEKRGKDGYACVHCHASHTLFNGTYGSAMNVANPADPERSLILLKPTSSSETEGIAGSDTVAHGGGVRWSKDSPEYVTILEWIKGAKE